MVSVIPDSVEKQIEEDVFNVVKVGTRAFDQLPVIDQARVYLKQNKSRG